jgi:hypothetical protein
MTFSIARTKTTPSAEFRNGYLIISGKSVPFEEPEIYDIIQERLTVYFEKPKKLTSIDFNFHALNAVSKRHLMDTLNLLEKINDRGNKILINWYYQIDNEDIFELGEICKANYKLKICLRQAN